MKKGYLLFLIFLLFTKGVTAQYLVGKITDADSAQTPLFMAEVSQIREGITIAIYKTYFDGTYRLKVKPNETYQLKVSYPGRSDTTLTIAVDKHATLYSGTLFISLHKDGLRLTGFILDRDQDIPIKDASLILKNVMTREEEKILTDVSGAYNLKMDYETNYTLRIDKMSPGIINKYQDTSFNISTIGFNKPLDFRMDIKLGPTNGYVAPRPEYDPHAKPVNRNLKPMLEVLGIKDTVKRREQDSIVAALHLKDSLIAALDRRLSDMHKAVPEKKVALRDDDVIAAQQAQKQKDLEKAEADLKAKQQAEKDLQDKLDKEVKDAEARKIEQEKIAKARAEKEQKEKEAAAKADLEAKQKARQQAELDSMLRVAMAKNAEIMARRKKIVDSLNFVTNQRLQAENEAKKLPNAVVDKTPTKEQEDSLLRIAEAKNRVMMAVRKRIQDSLTNLNNQRVLAAQNDVKKKKEQVAREQAVQDSLLKVAEAKNREMTLARKHTLDSLINIESQKAQAKTNNKKGVPAAQADSAKAQAARDARLKKELAARAQAEQDSMLKVAEAKNKEMTIARKRTLDSLIDIENQKNAQAKAEQLKTEQLQKEEQERELVAKQAEETKQKEADQKKKQAELAAAEKQKKEALEKSQKEEAERKKAELAAQEKYEKEELERKQKEEAEKKKAEEAARARAEAEEHQRAAAEQAALRKAREQAQTDSINKAEQIAADKRAQLQKDLAAMKKAREEAEAKVLAQRRDKEARDKMAKKEAKRVAKELEEQNKNQKLAVEDEKTKTEEQQRLAARKVESEKEQRELEAKKALEEQEKNQLTQQLGTLQTGEQAHVTKDEETKRQEYDPAQALKNEKEIEINDYEIRQRIANKRRSDSIAHVVNLSASNNAGNKLIRAKGFVKNGQTDAPVGNVAINIRRLNSIVSQEVISDANGAYDFLLDSGYFYLVSYYKDKYEISKQILDLTSYGKPEYTMVIQYLKEHDDFDPNAKMPVIQFEKNSSKVPADAWGDLETIVKMMKDIPDLKIILYGLASVDEDYPMELSVTRARLVADLLLESGIKPVRMRINGVGAYRPRSGCTEGKECTEAQYKLDRAVMYKVVKE